jgi:hypothetical protein
MISYNNNLSFCNIDGEVHSKPIISICCSSTKVA